MSTVNGGLDRRAAQAELANLTRHAQKLEAENVQLHKTLAELQRGHAEEARLLRGLTKLVKLATYDRGVDLLQISPLDAHSDPDVSYVWWLIQRKKLEG